MRIIGAAVLLAILPGLASAQTSSGNDPKFSVQFTAGPTVIDAGHTVAAGVGFSPVPQLTFVGTVQRDHVNFRAEPFVFRGGTITSVSGEVRYEPVPRLRVSPFGTIGMGWGESRPNVAGPYTNSLTNNARTLFAGGGVRIPVNDQLSVIAETRLVLIEEATEASALVPVRLGLAWRF